MQKLLLLLAIYLSPVILYCTAKAFENQPGLSLRETFDVYVKSVQNSDLKGLFSTVSESDDFFFLTSDGRILDRSEYYKFHEDWFKATNWEMPVKLLKVKQGKEYGYTNAIFHYRIKITEGKTYNLESYFTMIFRKEEGMWKVVADICTPIKRYITEPNADVSYNMDQEYLFRTIEERRTVRKYKSTPVPDEHIKRILDAARFAPTAGNQQPWKFLVVRDRKKLDQLKEEALQWYLDLYKSKKSPDQEELESTRTVVKDVLESALSAPVYIAVLVNSEAEHPDYIIQDGTLAAGNLMIAARALGYGTGFFTTFFPEGKMKDYLGIPDQYKLICFTPIGVPESWSETPPKKSLDEFIVYESFREK